MGTLLLRNARFVTMTIYHQSGVRTLRLHNHFRTSL